MLRYTDLNEKYITHPSEAKRVPKVLLKTSINPKCLCLSDYLVVVDFNDLKNGKEVSEVTEGKFNRMRWRR